MSLGYRVIRVSLNRAVWRKYVPVDKVQDHLAASEKMMGIAVRRLLLRILQLVRGSRPDSISHP